MKNTIYAEEVPTDLTGYTLVLPSVSVGNVGQLAVDLLLHNLACIYVGAFSHPSVQAVVGSMPDDSTGVPRLMTAVEAYVCKDKQLFVIQIRSPISPEGRLSLLDDLVAWAAALNTSVTFDL
ncbi:proteasome assembly chaperone 2-like [Pollicipes pollicipes]|uniref:proteasome assembly chaperone 2-like n=1 Tax=Pollicipes pollicipes TaxID=41117 RepID=UPI0018854FBF|nr:proteasome assembly chaperone 2-like [Pollicipes pollicipes]